jgi:hypothetical protein
MMTVIRIRRPKYLKIWGYFSDKTSPNHVTIQTCKREVIINTHEIIAIWTDLIGQEAYSIPASHRIVFRNGTHIDCFGDEAEKLAAEWRLRAEEGMKEQEKDHD